MFYFDWASTTLLHTSLRLQIPCICSLPTAQIYSTFNWWGIRNPVEQLWWSFFAEIVKAYGYFRRRNPPWMFGKILTAILPDNLLYVEEGLTGSFAPLGLHKGILDTPCLLILSINTKHNSNKMKSSFH